MEGAFGARFERNGLHTGGGTWFEHSHVAWPDRAWKRGGRAGAVSASFDWLNLRLDLVGACSRAVHVVRTPGRPDVRKVQFPDFLRSMPVFMTAFLLLAAGWDLATAANTTERYGSSYCACMTVPSPNDLDTVGRCVFFAKWPVTDAHRTARLNPVTTVWQGCLPFFWSRTSWQSRSSKFGTFWQPVRLRFGSIIRAPWYP